MRVTTNGTLYNYKSNLTNVTQKLNNEIEKLTTGREFNSYAADPAAATRAFKVHSQLNEVNMQHSNNSTIISKYNTAWGSVKAVADDLTNDLALVPAMQGLNGTNLDDLDSQASVLRSGAEAMIQTLNAKYDGEYVFAGADTLNVPFTIEGDKVMYRGLDINDPANQAALDAMTNESLYVDIGLGFELDAAGNVIDSSAFDAALSGIEITGYGVDADGDPKNIASIMMRLADIFDGYDTETNTWTEGSHAEASRLLDKLNESQQATIDKHASLSADAVALETNLTQLEDTYMSLNEERAAIEDVDQEATIIALSWANNVYQASIQIGANIIPQSLMDYLQ